MSDDGVPPQEAWLPTEEEEEAWLEEWAAVDRDAAAYLRERLRDLGVSLSGPDRDDATARLRSDLTRGDLTSRHPEAAYLRRANGWTGDLPDDENLWVQAVASTISPPEDPGTSAEEQSCVMALQHVDWLGMVLGLVRRGVGAELDAATVVADVQGLDDIDGEIEDPDGLLGVLKMAVEVLAPLWTYLGVLDDHRRLTRLGRWGLPIALARTWDPMPTEPARRLEPEVERAALEILAQAPRSLEDLRKALAKSNTIVSVDDLHAGLISHGDVWHFDDEVLGHIPTLLEDVVVTHVLTAEEKQAGILAAGADIDVWMLLADEGFPLAGSGTVTLRHRDHGYDVPGDVTFGLEGPEGWLDDFAAATVIGLRYVDGGLRLEPADPASYDQDVSYGDEVAALAAIIEEAVAYDEQYGDPSAPGASGAEVVYRMRRAHPGSLRRPLPALGLLAETLGYQVIHGYVCRPGARWDSPAPEWFSDAQAEVWRHWTAATAQWRSAHEAPPAEELRQLARDLDRRDLTGFVSPDVIQEPSLVGLLTAMEEAVEGRLLAVPLLLRASVAEAQGDLASYRALLDAAVAADADNAEALLDLADLHAIAGEAQEATRLYRLGGLPADADELTTLKPFLQPPTDGPGRNKPCPCGSGKKYKLCHGRTALHPLPNRAGWLWSKLCGFAQRTPQRAVMLEWGALLSGSEPGSTGAARAALQDPEVLDFAIIDGGLIGRFLTVMGELLPDDERSLAESWAGQPMRLIEVRRVVAASGVVVTDLLTVGELEIADRSLSRAAGAGDVLLGRPLDDGSGRLSLRSAPAWVPESDRDRLLGVLQSGGSAREIAAAAAGLWEEA